MVSINILPAEILIEIFNYGSAGTLKNCVSVDHRWHLLALPVLYANIVLRNSNIYSFLKLFNGVHTPLVHSITVTLHTTICAAMRKQDKNIGSTDPIAELSSTLLPQLTKLSTFSLCCRCDDCEVLINPAELSGLLNALPATCINLEIDLKQIDESPATRKQHICEDIRRILPRMEHVRIRLPGVCSALFGPIVPSDGVSSVNFNPYRDGKFIPIKIPKMRTLLVHIGWNRCLGYPSLPFPEDFKKGDDPPWKSITMALQALVTANPNASDNNNNTGPYFSPSAKLSAIHSGYSTFVYTDFPKQTTTVTPPFSCRNTRSRWNPTFTTCMRTVDGRELIAPSDTLAIVAEGAHHWASMVSGARLPTAILDTPGPNSYTANCIRERLRLMSVEEWGRENGGITSHIWEKEKKVGYRVMEAKVRVGEREGFLDLRALIN
ncbi:hypothetical protein FQN55_005228 [Onygenales sp. PD_40]|nr:hypothetical protein FQN55_005228 [Onygenales sp. PD_40]KAK2787763.1 hypothetical protein FQN52_007074 [Onygenales sp. PD_12]KAK2805920.1 hypothetical protein FQN51_008694 [Onygenales sp. PD_10]